MNTMLEKNHNQEKTNVTNMVVDTVGSTNTNIDVTGSIPITTSSSGVTYPLDVSCKAK